MSDRRQRRDTRGALITLARIVRVLAREVYAMRRRLEAREIPTCYPMDAMSPLEREQERQLDERLRIDVR